MKTSDAFPSDFLKAADLNNQSVTVTIESVEMVEIGQGRDKESKMLIKFRGKSKGLITNKTNTRTIEKLYGDETDNWIGQKIIIAPKEVEFQGDMVWAIRVSLQKPGLTPPTAARPVAPAPKPEPVRAPNENQAEGQNGESDDVPF